MGKPLEPGYLDPNQNHFIAGYGEWNEAFHTLPGVKKKVLLDIHLAVLSSLSFTERAFLGCGFHCGSPIDLLPKPSL